MLTAIFLGISGLALLAVTLQWLKVDRENDKLAEAGLELASKLFRAQGEIADLKRQNSVLESSWAKQYEECAVQEAIGVDLIVVAQELERQIKSKDADIVFLNGYVARLEEKLTEHGIALSADERS